MSVRSTDQGSLWCGDKVFTITVTDMQSSTTTSIVSDLPDPSTLGSDYAVTVTVTSAGGTPTGTVFVSDGVGGTCSITLANGTGACNLPSDAVSSRTLTATYTSNNPDFTASTSATQSHTIQKAVPAVTITSSSVNPSVTGQTYTVAFSVTHADRDGNRG